MRTYLYFNLLKLLIIHYFFPSNPVRVLCVCFLYVVGAQFPYKLRKRARKDNILILSTNKGKKGSKKAHKNNKEKKMQRVKQ